MKNLELDKNKSMIIKRPQSLAVELLIYNSDIAKNNKVNNPNSKNVKNLNGGVLNLKNVISVIDSI